MAATAARLLAPGRLATVTAVPGEGVPLPADTPSRCHHEWDHAQAIASLHGNIEAYRCPAPPPVPDQFAPTWQYWLSGSPIRNIDNLAWGQNRNRQVRELGARMVLGGQSGNFTLSFDGLAALMDLARSGHLARLYQEIHGVSRHFGSLWSNLRNWVLAPMAPPSVRVLYAKLRRRPDPLTRASAIHPVFLAELDLDPILAAESPSQDRLGYLRSQHRMGVERGFLNRQFPANLRPINGYEIRDPLGDIRLMEFCLAIPWEQYLRQGETRFLARRVLADRLPPQVVNNYQVGIQDPEWFHRLGQHRQHLLNEIQRMQQSPLASHCLNLPRMKAIAEQWPTSQQPVNSEIVKGVLARGVNNGRFIEWVENGSKPPPPPWAKPESGPPA